jgi:menaquinone-dependent protoporphyrinogen oxidase
MKTLIIYETLHGASEKCAEILKDKISHETAIMRLKHHDKINLDDYEIIIVGGSIHMGVIHTRVKEYIDKNLRTLISKPHGLFLCCMEQGENARIQFENAYPEELRKTAHAVGLFGGEFNFKKMNLFERKFTRKVAKIKTSVSHLRLEEIDKFAEKIESLKETGFRNDEL